MTSPTPSSSAPGQPGTPAGAGHSTPSRRWAMGAVAVLAAAAGAGVALKRFSPGDADLTGFWDRSFPTPNGDTLRLSSLRGQRLLVNFWATWCPPCREEMPELDKFAAQYSGTVAFYAVNIQEPASKVSEFMQTHNYKMPVLLDHDGTIGKQFRVSAIPTTVIVDKNGIIKYRKPGGVTFAEIENITKGL